MCEEKHNWMVAEVHTTQIPLSIQLLKMKLLFTPEKTSENLVIKGSTVFVKFRAGECKTECENIMGKHF